MRSTSTQFAPTSSKRSSTRSSRRTRASGCGRQHDDAGRGARVVALRDRPGHRGGRRPSASRLLECLSAKRSDSPRVRAVACCRVRPGRRDRGEPCAAQRDRVDLCGGRRRGRGSVRHRADRLRRLRALRFAATRARRGGHACPRSDQLARYGDRLALPLPDGPVPRSARSRLRHRRHRRFRHLGRRDAPRRRGHSRPVRGHRQPAGPAGCRGVRGAARDFRDDCRHRLDRHGRARAPAAVQPGDGDRAPAAQVVRLRLDPCRHNARARVRDDGCVLRTEPRAISS